ncbi:MAG: DUF4007 family protein [Motiliproteus sp.]
MKAKFTGHDTFPLRYGWLHKAINHLNNNKKLLASNENSTREAIVELGVGKNMVNGIRYWAECSGVIESDGETVTDKGAYLFGSSGIVGKDPYLEQTESVWLLHFWLNFNFDFLTAYRYFFNYSNVQHFEKSKLLDDCYEDVQRLVKGSVPNETTVKKDLDCFLNTYCHKQKKSTIKDSINEDYFSSPLSELNLLQDNGGGFYVSDLGERPDLPIEVFIYASIKFIEAETEGSNINTISFDALLTKPCSPGRIFRLSESGLGQKLDEAQTYKNSGVTWVDSLGLRQIKIEKKSIKNSNNFLDAIYAGGHQHD